VDDYRIVDNRDRRGGLIPLRQRFPRLAAAEHTSRAAAMALMCIQCMGGEIYTIAQCTDRKCPLHAWRPTTFERGRELPAERREALAERARRNFHGSR